ncbi:acyl-CoA thioesterase II [Pseudohongiella sp.]|uniref:Acyl-CoA thioesterase II n=1 Tax=marine sediment metagenome TaxID=412755 RepID=A0A0F9YAK1_9ZZZZ|nr:acyl-CoA thioesterase II [Pseudohongiella sp.]HDZ07905.1 acyl-CoA thioesterase II [Pseudohongiella sp.]HEA64488.1 acyl-CoA thioesterase II [Pseudohongiella sp.]
MAVTPNALENQQLQQLFNHLELEKLDENLYRSAHKNEGWFRVYGGQVLAQALLSASHTVPDDRHVHSLHAYFLRPGDLDQPIIFHVDRIRDGRSFTTRRVVAMQHGKAILNMAASFQIPEEGLSHQAQMPDVPPPEECASRKEMAERFRGKISEDLLERFSRQFAVDLRHVDINSLFDDTPKEPVTSVWFRVNSELPADYDRHAHLLAYASDMTLLQTSLRPHGQSLFDPKLQIASLDHAMWFHRPFRTDDWLLYAQDSPSSSQARGFNRGNIFTRDGVLVASVCQEGLMRVRD